MQKPNYCLWPVPKSGCYWLTILTWAVPDVIRQLYWALKSHPTTSRERQKTEWTGCWQCICQQAGISLKQA